MLGILIGFILTIILIGVSGFFLYPKLGQLLGLSGAGQPAKYGNSPNNPSGNCAPAAGETAFSGKVATVSPPDQPNYKQYTLQSTGGTTYYLNTTNPAQASSLESKLGKDVQVNGTLVRPNSNDVNVNTVCL